MSGVEIDEKHHISRHCKSRFIDGGLPISEAFLLRNNEGYLSVNWLEYFDVPDLEQAIDCVRQVFRDKNYTVKEEDRFVSFQVRKVKEIISRYSHIPARIVRKRTKYDPSHCGVLGYTGIASADKLIALKIAQLAHTADMYPGKLP